MHRFLIALLACAVSCKALSQASGAEPKSDQRPNFLVLISDDQSWLHTGLAERRTVKTPNFDQLAREGVVFTHAFCDSPGCAPSRAAMLSGQGFWRLREGAVQRASFPRDISVYPELLQEDGYQVGSRGKGWGPGKATGRKNNPAGKVYGGFERFLSGLPPGKPFCFWFGSKNPHRPYDPGSGLKSGKTPADAVVPAFLPDVDEVRRDLLDYYAEIEQFDNEVGQILKELERSGRAENTLVIVTSDNGMPFPRAKTNLYDHGVRVPLAVRWPEVVQPGRVVDDFVALSDCAPTILEAAGLTPAPEMTARSFLDVLASAESGRIDSSRDHVIVGREVHGFSWPCRALRTHEYLYIRNYAPGRIEGLVCDNSPTRKKVVALADDPQDGKFFRLAFGPREGDELYEIGSDPDQVKNVAGRPENAARVAKMREQLESELKQSGDPRALGQGEVFDNFPVAEPPLWLSPARERKAATKTATPQAGSPLSEKIDCELAVIGGGSGGFGAALAAARLGVDVVLVEKADCLGGISVRSGVNCWEMGAGGTGIPFDLYRRLKKEPLSIGIYAFGRHQSWYDPKREPYRYPGGECVIDPQWRYLDTLQRHVPHGRVADQKYKRRYWHGVPFEPDAMAQAMKGMLEETGHCRVLLNSAFVSVNGEKGRIRSARLSNGAQVNAKWFIDSTGDGLVCAEAGCETMFGQEAREAFDEPDAPEKPTNRINGVSLIFRVTPVETPAVEPLPEGIPAKCWWSNRFPSSHVNHFPNGDLNFNMLPTMQGAEFYEIGYDKAMEECRRRVYAQWHYIQSHFDEFRGYRLSSIYPALGVRETRRVVGEYVLNENDLLAGLSGQEHPDIICVADHMMDTHGSHSRHRGELKEPYGVPYRCLIPKGIRNLLVACRGASFSSLAASSCRLSRTMIQLGQAAGTAVSIAKELNVDLPDIPSEMLRANLRRQHVQLDHPMPEELRKHLGQE